jgi:hypothetical protein
MNVKDIIINIIAIIEIGVFSYMFIQVVKDERKQKREDNETKKGGDQK